MNIKWISLLFLCIISFNGTTSCMFPFWGKVDLKAKKGKIYLNCTSFSGKLKLSHEDIERLFKVKNAEITTYPALLPVVQKMETPDEGNRYYIDYRNMGKWALGGIVFATVGYLAMKIRG